MKQFPVSIGIILCLAGTAQAQQVRSIDARAEQVFEDACKYLAQAPFFGINAEVWREHLDSDGQKVQFSRMMDLEVVRPNRLHAEIHSPHSQRGFWYDGRSLTVLDRKRNFFSSTSMPSTLDAALDAAHDQFGIDLPMIDLAVSDPFTNGMARVISAKYYGLAPAMGYSCHHLAFTQDNIDWQVWIQEGPQPFIRKFIITHKNEPGSPEFTALIRSWNLTDRISDRDFVFSPPSGAMKIQMSSDSPELGENAGLKPTGVTEPRK